MDLILVRTKLESIIAKQLIEKNIIQKKYILIQLYQNSVHEDDKSVYEFYSKLSKNAALTLNIVESKGMLTGFSKYFLVMLYLRMTNGNLFYAGINNYPIALSMKVLFFKNIYTFDNGNVNIDPFMTGSYHKNNILNGSSLKRRIARKIFPLGSNNFVIKKIKHHFTIFPNYKNIVSVPKTVPLQIDWKNHLSGNDISLTTKKIQKIMLGTVFSERTMEQQLAREKYLKNVDLYIAHPREDINFHSSKIINPISPVESLIEYWKNENDLEIYHFNSTVFRFWEGEKNIKFINLDPDIQINALNKLDRVIQKYPKIHFKESQKFLVSSPEVNAILLEKDFMEIQYPNSLKVMLLPKIAAIWIYGYMKLIYLFLIQRNGKPIQNIDHLVLESDSIHMYQNYFKIHEKIKKKKYLVIKAYEKNSFTSITKVPFKLLNKNFISSVKELTRFSKVTSSNIFNIAYKNIFKSISIYAYWNALFAFLNEEHGSITLYSSCCQIPDCAASNVGFKSVYIAHGLIDKFYTLPSFNEIWVYSNDEKIACENLLQNGNTKIYDFKKIDSHSNKILLVLSALDYEMDLDKLIDICNEMTKKNFLIVARLHPSNMQSKIFSRLQESVDFQIELNQDGSVAEALRNTNPFYSVGWTSTGLCESLNMNIIPISLSKKNDPLIGKMIYKIKRRSLFWPENNQVILNVAENRSDYKSTINYLQRS